MYVLLAALVEVQYQSCVVGDFVSPRGAHVLPDSLLL